MLYVRYDMFLGCFREIVAVTSSMLTNLYAHPPCPTVLILAQSDTPTLPQGRVDTQKPDANLMKKTKKKPGVLPACRYAPPGYKRLAGFYSLYRVVL